MFNVWWPCGKGHSNGEKQVALLAQAPIAEARPAAAMTDYRLVLEPQLDEGSQAAQAKNQDDEESFATKLYRHGVFALMAVLLCAAFVLFVMGRSHSDEERSVDNIFGHCDTRHWHGFGDPMYWKFPRRQARKILTPVYKHFAHLVHKICPYLKTHLRILPTMKDALQTSTGRTPATWTVAVFLFAVANVTMQISWVLLIFIPRKFKASPSQGNTRGGQEDVTARTRFRNVLFAFYFLSLNAVLWECTNVATEDGLILGSRGIAAEAFLPWFGFDLVITNVIFLGRCITNAGENLPNPLMSTVMSYIPVSFVLNLCQASKHEQRRKSCPALTRNQTKGYVRVCCGVWARS